MISWSNISGEKKTHSHSPPLSNFNRYDITIYNIVNYQCWDCFSGWGNLMPKKIYAIAACHHVSQVECRAFARRQRWKNGSQGSCLIAIQSSYASVKFFLPIILPQRASGWMTHDDTRLTLCVSRTKLKTHELLLVSSKKWPELSPVKSWPLSDELCWFCSDNVSGSKVQNL